MRVGLKKGVALSEIAARYQLDLKASPLPQTLHPKSGIVAWLHADGRLKLSGKGVMQELGKQVLEWLER